MATETFRRRPGLVEQAPHQERCSGEPMKPHSLSSTYAVIGLVSVSLACGTADEPSDQDYDDVASAVAPLILGDSSDASSIEDSVEVSRGRTPMGFRADGLGRISGARGRLRYNYLFACRNGSGALQDLCDGTTDTATISVSWSGSVETPRYSAEINRTGTYALSGLTGDRVELNGEGTFDVRSEFTSLNGNRSRTYMLDYDALYSSITFDRTLRKIVAGTASFVIIAERTASNQFRDVEASFSVEAVVTFTNEGATLVLDGDRSYNLVTTGNTVTVTR